VVREGKREVEKFTSRVLDSGWEFLGRGRIVVYQVMSGEGLKSRETLQNMPLFDIRA
jgi:hypothetical protein